MAVIILVVLLGAFAILTALVCQSIRRAHGEERRQHARRQRQLDELSAALLEERFAAHSHIRPLQPLA